MPADEAPAPDANRTLLTEAAVVLATGLGIGRAPLAPGTFGTLLGLPLAWVISRIDSFGLQVAVIVCVCAVGIPICTQAARRLRAKDPGAIVLDEIASLPMTFFLVPIDSAWTVVAGFVLHRVFDIAKPPPARQLERLPEGLGIMADDWIAGLYSNLALRLLVWSGIFAVG
jgi:phosphatidylglycerophosphatase A